MADMITVNEHKIKVEPSEDVVNITIGTPINLVTNEVTTITQQYELAEAIGGHRVVYLYNNKIYLATPDNSFIMGKVIGVTQQAGNAGDVVNVVVFGKLNGFSGIEGSVYYLGSGGQLTQYRPSGNVINIEVGKGLKSDTVFIEIKNYVKRIS